MSGIETVDVDEEVNTYITGILLIRALCKDPHRTIIQCLDGLESFFRFLRTKSQYTSYLKLLTCFTVIVNEFIDAVCINDPAKNDMNLEILKRSLAIYNGYGIDFGVLNKTDQSEDFMAISIDWNRLKGLLS